MTRQDDVLERNLELLFTRSYEPVEPSAAFRARLLRSLEGELAAAERKRPAPVWRIAAGFLLLLGAALLGWALFVRSAPPRDGHGLVVDGEPAPRDAAAEESSSDSEPPGGTAEADPALDPASQASHERTQASAVTPAEAEPESGTRQGAPTEVAGAEKPATLHGTLVFPPGEGSRPAPSPQPTGTKPAEFTVTVLRTVRLPAVSEPESRSFPLETGEFVLDDLKAGTWAVFVHVEGFAISVKRGLELSADETTELRVEMDRGVTLRGRVVDAEGKPVEGAEILAEEDTPTQVLPFDLEPLAPFLPNRVKSDLGGAFELHHVGAGQKILRATRTGHGAGWTQKIDPSALASSDGIEVRLTRAGAIEGRVVRNDGTPWPQAMVVTAHLDMTYERPCMSFGSAMADAEGRYAVPDLAPGAYVVLNAGEQSPAIRQVLLGEGQRLTVDLPGTLTGTSLEGTLLSGDGKPLSGYDVTLVSCDRREAQEDAQEDEWKAVRSDAEGRFHFPDLQPGVYDVYVGGNLGIQFTRISEIDVPEAPVFRPTIRAGTGSLRGKVTDARTGVALPGSVVVVEIEKDGAFEFAGKTVGDGEGIYTIDLLPAGRYRAMAYATVGRYGTEMSAEAEIGEGSPASVHDFALRPGADLTVRVTDRSGRPVPGAYVQFVDASGATISFSQNDLTDGNGVFRARGMKPGRWAIDASREPDGKASATVDLAGDEERSLELVLTTDK